MKTYLELFKEDKEKADEPALGVGSSIAAMAGLLSMVNLFFPNFMNEKQTTLVFVIFSFALPIATAAFTRGKVWSPASVAILVNEAVSAAQEAMVGIHKKEKDEKLDRILKNIKNNQEEGL